MRISDWSSDVCSSDLHPTKWLAGQAFSGPTCQDIRSAGGVAGRVDAIRSIVHSTADRRSESYSGDCAHAADQNGRASGRERVCQSVSISVVAGSFKKTNNKTYICYTQLRYYR